MMIVYEFLKVNYATVLCSVGLIIILLFNRGAERWIKYNMLLSAVTVLMLAIADYVDVEVAYDMNLLGVRFAASTLGYMLRPLPLYLMILSVRHHKKNNILWAIPLIFNACLLAINPFFNIVFGLNDIGGFRRGVLGYMPHVVGFFYLGLVGYCALRLLYDNNYSDGFILAFMEFVAISAVLMETYTAEKIYVSTAYAIFNLLYYMFVHVQIVAKDHLTGLLNRVSFYEDCHRFKNSISGVISVDMNELKRINDNEGHAAGDKALVEVADCLRSAFKQKCTGYRMGGDEFIILIWEGAGEETEAMIALCRKLVEEKGYSCAFGTAYYDKASQEARNIRTLMKDADAKMYEDKRRLKAIAADGIKPQIRSVIRGVK